MSNNEIEKLVIAFEDAVIGVDRLQALPVGTGHEERKKASNDYHKARAALLRGLCL